MEDNRRFPPSAYEEASLVWRDAEWRQPTPHERAQLMGLPPESFDCVPGEPALRRQTPEQFDRQWVPPVFRHGRVLPAAPSLGSQVPTSHGGRGRDRPQVQTPPHGLEPGRLDHFPGLSDSPHITGQLAALFPDCVFTPQLMADVQRPLSHCDLHVLQSYVAWCRLRGMPTDDLAHSRWGATNAHGSTVDFQANAIPLILPVAWTTCCRRVLGNWGTWPHPHGFLHPFQATEWPEHDVVFTIEAICVWRQFLPAFSAKLRRTLRSVAQAVQPLEDALDSWRVESAHRVASTKRPGFVAVMTIMLRWPDRLQAQCLVRGYPIVGQISQTGISGPWLLGKLTR